MKTSKNFANITALLFLMILFFASCCTDSVEAEADANEVLERIDIQVDGDLNLDVYKSSLEKDNVIDLIRYNYFGQASNGFEIKLALDLGYTLRIRMYHHQLSNIANQVNIPYDLHVTQELDDKLQYVIMDVQNSDNAEAPDYTSMVIGNQGVFVNAFSIVDYNYMTKEVLCRINHVVLHNQFDYDRTINMVGTFRGAITFQ